MATGKQGKQLRSARGSSDNDMLDAIKEALQDDHVVAGLAKRIASVVTETIAARLNAMDKLLRDKDEKIKQLEEHVKRVDAQLDHMEQYSRRSSVRVTGIKENEGEDLDWIVTNLMDDMDVQDMNINNINRMHRVGPRNSLTNKNHARQIIIQFKDYKSKKTFIKARKSLRGKHPNVYIAEDLTKPRYKLLYVARTLKKARKIQDCWSYDGRIMIKDLQGEIGSVNREDDLNRF